MSEKSDIIYSTIVSGIPGSPEALRAATDEVVTLNNATHTGTRDFIVANNIYPCFEWADLNAYYTWANDTSSVSQAFFYPSYQPNGIYGLQIAPSGSGFVYIIPLDENGNRLPDTSEHRWISTSPPAYAGDVVPAGSPIQLGLLGNINDESLYFSFFGKPAGYLIADYPSLSEYTLSLRTGSSDNYFLIEKLIDPDFIIDPESIAPTGGTGGTGGMFDYPYGAIPEPALPTYSVADTGMISIWNCTPAQLYMLANKLWSTNFFDNIIKNFQSPFDNIVSLQVVPFTVYGGTQANIHIGNYNTEVPSNKLSTTYFKIDCGNLALDGAYKTFADYSYTEIKLYLPYIGIVPLSPDDIMDKAINVKYNIDVFSGACVAYIRSYIRGQWTVLNQYQGNITTQYPITGANFASVYSGYMSSLTGALTSGAMLATAPANPAMTIGAAGTASNAINSTLMARPTYQRSGGVSSSAGLMSVQKPYLIITKPNFIQAKDFRSIKGYVSNLQCTIGNESGYLSATVNNEMLININCTDTEKDLIREALSEGVYI